MKTKTSNSNPKTSLWIAFTYLFLSFFAALRFSILAYRSRNNGNSGLVWILLSIICIAFFGFLSIGYIESSSLKNDVFWYYLGWSSLIVNSVSLLIVVKSIFKKRK